MDLRAATSPPAAPTTSTSRSTCRPARSGSGRRSASPTARCAATARSRQGRPPPAARVPDRAAAAAATSPARVDQRAQVVDPVRDPRREPAPGPRRRRRRGHREREGPRADPAARPRPGRDDRGLRAARPRGRARGRPRPRGRGRRRRRRRFGAGADRAVGRVRAGRLRFDQLVPNPDTLQKITDRLEESRVIGTRAIVEPPVYRGITVVAKLKARSRVNPTRLQEEALLALYEYFHPITGGPDGTGWPFGRPVNAGEIYSVLQGIRGTELVEDARLFGADPVTGAARAADPAPRARDACARVQLRAPGPGRGRLMRGDIPGLETPHPMGPALPGPVPGRRLRPADARRARRGRGAGRSATIDNFDSYLDPSLTPDDFLAWLAGWVGIALDEGWDEARRRAIVARAVELYRLRGTAAGLAGQVEIQTGGTVEIVENGATGWSVDPGGELPGSADPLVVVRVTVPDPKAIDAQQLDTLVADGQAGPRDAPDRDRQGRREGLTPSTTSRPVAAAAPRPSSPPRRRHAWHARFRSSRRASVRGTHHHDINRPNPGQIRTEPVRGTHGHRPS